MAVPSSATGSRAPVAGSGTANSGVVNGVPASSQECGNTAITQLTVA